MLKIALGCVSLWAMCIKLKPFEFKRVVENEDATWWMGIMRMGRWRGVGQI